MLNREGKFLNVAKRQCDERHLNGKFQELILYEAKNPMSGVNDPVLQRNTSCLFSLYMYLIFYCFGWKESGDLRN